MIEQKKESIFRRIKEFISWHSFIITTSIFMSSLILLIFVMAYADAKAKIVEFESVRESLNQARIRNSGVELAAIQHKVIEANKWLAKEQYYNSTFLVELFTLDEVDSLKPIR